MTTTNAEHPFQTGKVILINKEYLWTSFDVVKRLRGMINKICKIKKFKIGHAGTLDPLATGLMILCTGKFTKRISEIQDQEKEYVATITLGATTPSFDLETEIDKHFPTEHIDRQLVEKVLAEQFSGEINQYPPIFSAKRVDGIRAYEHARAGVDVELKAVPVTIYKTEIIRYEMPQLELRIVCSKGTYIRSLAHDLGKALGSGAHLSALVRTRIGNYCLKDAILVAEFQNNLTKA